MYISVTNWKDRIVAEGTHDGYARLMEAVRRRGWPLYEATVLVMSSPQWGQWCRPCGGVVYAGGAKADPRRNYGATTLRLLPDPADRAAVEEMLAEFRDVYEGFTSSDVTPSDERAFAGRSRRRVLLDDLAENRRRLASGLYHPRELGDLDADEREALAASDESPIV